LAVLFPEEVGLSGFPALLSPYRFRDFALRWLVSREVEEGLL
jgi:hypothetical protein